MTLTISTPIQLQPVVIAITAGFDIRRYPPVYVELGLFLDIEDGTVDPAKNLGLMLTVGLI